jgi:very-short-patch-repair endonuclease
MPLSVDARCGRIASLQHGCISLAQAEACGVSARAARRRAEAGAWARIFPRVYALAGAPGSWRQTLMAAVLWGGPKSYVCHRSAAALWSLPGFPEGPVELVTARTRAPRPIRLHRPARLMVDQTAVVDRIPVTSPARTLLDLSRNTPRPLFEAAFHHCLRTRLTTIDAMRRMSARHQGRGAFGAPTLRAAVALYDGHGAAPESPLESRLLRVLLDAGLPVPTRQHRVTLPGATRRLDFAWPDALVGLEADSYQWHSSPIAWRADRRRLAELREAGWVILSATADDVRDPDRLVRSLTRALTDVGRPRLHE